MRRARRVPLDPPASLIGAEAGVALGGASVLRFDLVPLAPLSDARESSSSYGSILAFPCFARAANGYDKSSQGSLWRAKTTWRRKPLCILIKIRFVALILINSWNSSLTHAPPRFSSVYIWHSAADPKVAVSNPGPGNPISI